jgi:hypothetical protein
MRRRPWSCLALALLLLWQLGSAVAIALPQPAATGHPGTAIGHCAGHGSHGAPTAGHPAGGAETPAPPSCCHHGAGTCHCAQMAALLPPLIAFGDVRPPDAPSVLPGEPHVAARSGDFFRPPI